MAAGEGSTSASGSAKSKKKAVCGKYFEKVSNSESTSIVMEKQSVELVVIFVVRSLLTMGPLLP